MVPCKQFIYISGVKVFPPFPNLWTPHANLIRLGQIFRHEKSLKDFSNVVTEAPACNDQQGPALQTMTPDTGVTLMPIKTPHVRKVGIF